MATYLDYLRKDLGIEMKWDEKRKGDITQETKEKIAQTDRFVAFVSSAISAGAAVSANKAAQAKVDTYAESQDLTKVETPKKGPLGRDRPLAKTISYEGKIGDEFVSFTPEQMTSIQKAELYQGKDFNTIVEGSLDRFRLTGDEKIKRQRIEQESLDWSGSSRDKGGSDLRMTGVGGDPIPEPPPRPSVPVASEDEFFDDPINVDYAALYDLEPITIQATIKERDISAPLKKEPSALEAINDYYEGLEIQKQEKIAFDKQESERLKEVKQKFSTGNTNIFNQKKPQNPLLYQQYVQMYGEEKAKELLGM